MHAPRTSKSRCIENGFVKITVNANDAVVEANVTIRESETKPETQRKCKIQNLENTAHVPPPEEEESIFIEIPKPKAKKTVNVEIQDLNFTRPNSYQSKLPYPERMKVRENDKPSAQHSRFLKMFKQLRLEIGLKECSVKCQNSTNGPYSVIDFSKSDPFSGSTTKTLPPSSSPVKTSDNLEKFANELALLDSLPPDNDNSTLKKDFHEVNFQVYSNPLFEFDDNFKSSNVNPFFEENDKDAEIKSSSFTLTSPEESEFEAYLEIDLIPPGIDLTLPPTLEVSSSNPTSPSLTGEKIICLLATYLHQKPKLLSRSQEVEEIKEKEDEVSSDVPIDTIVMPIRITFDNPIDFNDHFSKPKDFKKDLTVSFDSSESSILPSPLLDSDSPFTAELSASVTLNSLGNEDK
ncbi:hypothetical protein Tco_0031728, partial [Tanacetum coccineum]